MLGLLLPDGPQSWWTKSPSAPVDWALWHCKQRQTQRQTHVPGRVGVTR